MKNAMFLTPVVTIFDKVGKINVEENKKVWEYLIQNEIDGIVLFGSTGEFFSIEISQKKELIEEAVKAIKNRVKLYVGTGSMTVEETVELSNFALQKGADAVMIISPYYFSLSNESIEYYYDEVAKKINGEIYIYNFPDRTGYDVTPEITLNLLKKNKNIVGYKDTVTEIGHTRKLIEITKKDFPNFEVYCGFDENFAHNMLMGGKGCIGGLSNLYPKVFSKWVKAINDKKIDEIENIQNIVDKMMDLYDIGTPFIPIVKSAMKEKNIIDSDYSIVPFLSAHRNQKEKIKELLMEIEKNI